MKTILEMLFPDKSKPQTEKIIPVKLIKQTDVANVEMKRLVYGIVLKPDVVDAHGDIMTADDVMWSAHQYMMWQYVGEQHDEFADAQIVESYIAPIDFKLNGNDVPKGAWVICIKIVSDDLWMKIITGVYTAFSAGGYGFVEEI